MQVMVDHLTSKALDEKRAAIVPQMREMTELVEKEGREFTTEENVKFEAMHTDYEALKARSLTLARVEAFEDELQQRADGITGEDSQRQTPGRQDTGTANPSSQKPKITEQTRSDAFGGWALYHAGREDAIGERHTQAAQDLGVRFTQPDWTCELGSNYRQVRAMFGHSIVQQRALGKDTDTAGGFTVPEGFVPNLERALLQFGGMRNIATVLRTETGNNLPWATSNDTTNEGAVVGENATITTQDPTFGQIEFFAYKYTSLMVRVPMELLTDSAFDIASELGMMLGERIARRTNRDYTAGDGAGKATGVTVDATTGVTAGAATIFTVDNLYELKHSVDPAYRLTPTWVLNDTTLLAIKKKKDGEGRYLWQASLAGGVPDTIDGDPIQINQHMPLATSGLKPIAYGDFSKYVIRDVLGIRTRRLVERYADNDQEGFVSFMRTDGKIIDAGTNPIKVLVMA
jgi:HK97 family phage major capsid protein